jgi:hypothetical protein
VNTCWQCRVLCLSLVSLSIFGCVMDAQLKPVERMSPRTHAERIYELLLAREGHSPQRDPRTLSGFPEAPTEVAQQLEALAASKQGKEREALLELAQALRRTGLYSQVMFRAKPNDIVVKYKALARTETQAAHAGWNNLPIGFYEVWAERQGKAVSKVNEYDVIQRKLVIDLTIN